MLAAEIGLIEAINFSAAANPATHSPYPPDAAATAAAASVDGIAFFAARVACLDDRKRFAPRLMVTCLSLPFEKSYL